MHSNLNPVATPNIYSNSPISPLHTPRVFDAPPIIDEAKNNAANFKPILNAMFSSLNPNATIFTPISNFKVYNLNPKVQIFKPILNFPHVAETDVPRNIANSWDTSILSNLDMTPCVNEISTPPLSEMDPSENRQLHTAMPPYFNLFCYILSALMYISICTPIGSGHGSFRNEFNISAPLGKGNISHIDDDRDPHKLLKNIKVSNVNRLVIGQLNINSLRNKIEALKLIIGQNIDILIITETKLDETFPKAQFYIDGYAPPEGSSFM